RPGNREVVDAEAVGAVGGDAVVGAHEVAAAVDVDVVGADGERDAAAVDVVGVRDLCLIDGDRRPAWRINELGGLVGEEGGRSEKKGVHHGDSYAGDLPQVRCGNVRLPTDVRVSCPT